MARLIILTGPKWQIHDTAEGVVSLGRAVENTICLDDSSVSRRHCFIEKVNGRWRVRDNKSFNGTFVNNLSVSEAWLQAGDRIQVGQSSIFFTPTESDATAPPGKSGPIPVPVQAPSGQVGAQNVETSRKLQNLIVLAEINKMLNTELDPEKLLELIMEKAIEITKAERGFVVLVDADGQLSFKVARNVEKGNVDRPEFNVSRKIIEKVVKSGEPVVATNAQSDLGSFRTVMALELRSLMVIPLKAKEHMLGVLYLDSRISEALFADEQLNLLQAFADQAAIALETARLYHDAVESRNKEQHTRLVFQKFVPSEVVNQILERKSESMLTGTRQRVTTLFSDIRNFTPLSEPLSPEELVQFLNHYFTMMGEAIFSEQGVLDKYIGDAVMALFGAPLTKPDDAKRAVRAAVKMMWQLALINQELQAQGRAPINIGIGIHTGQVIAGNIGSEKKIEYTVIGDAVNLASRLESANKELHTNILISEDTYREVYDSPDLQAGIMYRVRKLNPIAVKGKTGQIQIYQVIPGPPPWAQAGAETIAAPASPTAPTAPATPAAGGDIASFDI